MKKQTISFVAGMAGAVLTLGTTAFTAHAGTTLNSLDRTFITTVGHGNVAEIQASRLALKKSSNSRVRMIAAMLIQQHGQAQQALLKLGTQVSYSVPTAPDPTQKAQYRRLKHLSGAAFDKAFMQGQVGAHYATLDLFKKEMADGQQTLVHSYAQQYITDIQNHTQMIANVASNMGITVAESSSTGRVSSASMPAAATKMGK